MRDREAKKEREGERDIQSETERDTEAQKKRGRERNTDTDKPQREERREIGNRQDSEASLIRYYSLEKSTLRIRVPSRVTTKATRPNQRAVLTIILTATSSCRSGAAQSLFRSALTGWDAARSERKHWARSERKH